MHTVHKLAHHPLKSHATYTHTHMSYHMSYVTYTHTHMSYHMSHATCTYTCHTFRLGFTQRTTHRRTSHIIHGVIFHIDTCECGVDAECGGETGRACGTQLEGCACTHQHRCMHIDTCTCTCTCTCTSHITPHITPHITHHTSHITHHIASRTA